jgi:hypothetical protein
MRYILLMGCSLLLVAACNDDGKKVEAAPELVKESSIAVADSVVPDVHTDSIPKNIQVDSVIQIAFANDSTSVTVKGHLDKKGDPVICYLLVTEGKKLTASVTPEKTKANIRFGHLYLPDGKSDGPFSPNLKYDLVQRGVYKLYISPNKMAGDPVSTDFTLKVKVE